MDIWGRKKEIANFTFPIKSRFMLIFKWNMFKPNYIFSSCPFDFLSIKDGRPNSNAENIGTFCGKYENTTIVYSSREYMSMEFVTRSGRVSFDPDKLHNNADFKFDRRGFNISYEFSNRFTKLGTYSSSLLVFKLIILFNSIITMPF